MTVRSSRSYYKRERHELERQIALSSRALTRIGSVLYSLAAAPSLFHLRLTDAGKALVEILRANNDRTLLPAINKGSAWFTQEPGPLAKTLTKALPVAEVIGAPQIRNWMVSEIKAGAERPRPVLAPDHLAQAPEGFVSAMRRAKRAGVRVKGVDHTATGNTARTPSGEEVLFSVNVVDTSIPLLVGSRVDSAAWQAILDAARQAPPSR